MHQPTRAKGPKTRCSRRIKPINQSAPSSQPHTQRAGSVQSTPCLTHSSTWHRTAQTKTAKNRNRSLTQCASRYFTSDLAGLLQRKNASHQHSKKNRRFFSAWSKWTYKELQSDWLCQIWRGFLKKTVTMLGLFLTGSSKGLITSNCPGIKISIFSWPKKLHNKTFNKLCTTVQGL